MVGKQLGYNLLELFKNRVYRHYKIHFGATKIFNKKIEECKDDPTLVKKAKVQELKLRKDVEEQLLMAMPEKNLINFYMEAMIQFGFIAMFANTFPLAPLFSVFTNILEIKIKLYGMCKYSRRSVAEGAGGIGVWL